MVGWKGRLFNTFANVLPKKMAYTIRYYHWNKRIPNLDNPSRFTEKMMWLTEYNFRYNADLVKEIYDKHTARSYVAGKGLENVLTTELGCYKNANDIDFDKLPNKFILKATQSSGQNIIVRDKSAIDEELICTQLNSWISQKKYVDCFQGYYYTNDEKIMCEELLEDENGSIPTDVRLCCCNGKVKWIYCDIDTIDENMKHKKVYNREYFDRDWNFIPVDNPGRVRKNKNTPTLKKPENLELLISVAERLSKDFIFVRVDLYNLGERVCFGELTPIPGMAGGFNPDEWDYKFGEMISLPDVALW